MCVADGWWFADDDLDVDLQLLGAFTVPPNGVVPASLEPLFSEDDGWRKRRPDQLAAWLQRRHSMPSDAAASHVTTCVHSAKVSSPPPPPPPPSPLHVATAELAGRGLCAAEDLAAGTLLLQERAHSAVLWPSAASTHCHSCLQALQGGQWHQGARCAARGCRERYCSGACAAAAQAYHAAECGTRWHATAPRTVVLCARALLVGTPNADEGAAKLAEPAAGSRQHVAGPSRRPAPPIADAAGPDAKALAHALHGGISGLLRLHDNGPSFPASRRSLIRFHAFLACAALAPSLETARGGGACVELALLLRLALTNVFAISDLVPIAPVADALPAAGTAAGCASEALESRVVGEAFFARAALLNHSCEPNTSLTLRGTRLELRASTALASGEAVHTSYGPQAGFTPVGARRKALRRLYFFRCACSACTRDAASSAALDAHRARAQRLDDAARDACDRGSFGEAADLCAAAIDELRHVFSASSTMIAHEEAKLAKLRFNAHPGPLAAAALEQAAMDLERCHGSTHEEARECRRLLRMCAPG